MIVSNTCRFFTEKNTTSQLVSSEAYHQSIDKAFCTHTSTERSTMKAINLYPADGADHLACPEKDEGATMQTAALEFFTDFKYFSPIVIDSNSTAIEANNFMIKAHVRLQFVVDDLNHILGTLSSENLEDQNLIKMISNGFLREEITVLDLMTPRKELVALDIEEVYNATISDIITALKESNHQHCLVIDRSNQNIRGIFSASDLSRKLKLPINIQTRSSFHKVYLATKY